MALAFNDCLLNNKMNDEINENTSKEIMSDVAFLKNVTI
jgi:hypothetical protein